MLLQDRNGPLLGFAQHSCDLGVDGRLGLFGKGPAREPTASIAQKDRASRPVNNQRGPWRATFRLEGECSVELHPGVDADLGEDLLQVVLDGTRTDE
jgi:hypothetical protein